MNPVPHSETGTAPLPVLEATATEGSVAENSPSEESTDVHAKQPTDLGEAVPSAMQIRDDRTASELLAAALAPDPIIEEVSLPPEPPRDEPVAEASAPSSTQRSDGAAQEAASSSEPEDVLHEADEEAAGVRITDRLFELRRARAEKTAHQKTIAIRVGGAVIAFAVGTALSLAVTSSGSASSQAPRVAAKPSAPQAIALADKPIAPPPALATPASRPTGVIRVLHTRQGNAGVEMGRRVVITRKTGGDVVGTLVAASNGYVDVDTRRGRERVKEAEIVDASTE